ncbi:MAG: AtpZ/AtpI family protein [Desulfovibrionaceae bacterium]
MFGKLIKDKALREAIASASVVGLNLVTATFVGLLIGYWLDRWLGTKPWLLLVFLVLGIVAGFKNVVSEVRKIQKADTDEPTDGKDDT